MFTLAIKQEAPNQSVLFVVPALMEKDIFTFKQTFTMKTQRQYLASKYMTMCAF